MANGGVARHGAVGGVLAATAIAIFFLLFDAFSGELFRTPTFLASVLLDRQPVQISFGFLALYTALHYAAFVVIGVATAWVLEAARAPASILLGLVVGFFLFDLVFYASVAFTGVNVVEALGWPSFLAGNLIGGLTLMTYLRWADVAPGRGWADALAEHRVLREGLIAGLLGGLAVAAWFFVVDLGAGRLLYTPAALGSALFMGVDAPGAVEVTASTVLGYTGLHFAGFIAMGLVFAALVSGAEESPPLLMGLILLFVTFETLMLGLVAIVAAWLLDVVPWWNIALSNVLAASVMVAYLWWAHPMLAELDWGEREASAGGAGT